MKPYPLPQAPRRSSGPARHAAALPFNPQVAYDALAGRILAHETRRLGYACPPDCGHGDGC